MSFRSVYQHTAGCVKVGQSAEKIISTISWNYRLFHSGIYGNDLYGWNNYYYPNCLRTKSNTIWQEDGSEVRSRREGRCSES